MEEVVISSLNSKDQELTAAPAASTQAELDSKLRRLSAEAGSFARLSPIQKAKMLGQIRHRFWELSPRMVELGCTAKGIDPSSPLSGEEWFSGPAIALRGLRLFEEALREIAEFGAPRIEPNALRNLPNGRTSVRVTPRGSYDRTLFSGWKCEAWLTDRTPAESVIQTHASFYRSRAPEGRVTLVLGAGNVGSIALLDLLHHAFARGSVCLLKMSPVNAYLGPLVELAFEPLVVRGFLALAYGGAEVGAYLCDHQLTDAIHITGSVETHDAIVWGPPGPEREDRKRSGRPRLDKPVTSELGNISPVLITPAEYSDRELTAMARNIAGMLVQNASFNCNAAKMLVTARGWPQRKELFARLEQVLGNTPARLAYYPGAADRYRKLLASTAGAKLRQWGDNSEGKLPWTLVSGLDPDSASPLFRIEPFCSIFAETEVGRQDPIEFLAAATEFANTRLWGTLNALVMVPAQFEKDPRLARALNDAIAELRYGTVAVNLWPALAFGLVTPPWGGHPSSTLADVQSGIGWGHDALMLESVEKVVLRGPLLGFPEHFWYPGHQHLDDLGRALARFEAEPGPSRVLTAAWAALRP